MIQHYGGGGRVEVRAPAFEYAKFERIDGSRMTTAELDKLVGVTSSAFKGAPSHERVRQTHCRNGHEYTAETLMPRSDGHQECRICKNKHMRDRYAETHGKAAR